MDLSSIRPQESASSSSALNTQQPHLSPATSSEPKPIRSSARVKAAKQKLQLSSKSKDSEPTNAELEPGTSTGLPELIGTRSTRTSPTKTTRLREGNTGKGKDKEVLPEASSRSHKRPRRNPPSTSSPLTINEPVRDPKGKKRAAPEPEEDDTAGPSVKRSRTSTYSLRSSTTHLPEMPRKARTSAKGKALKSKMAAAGSSHIESDVEMLDPERTKHDESDIEPQMGEKIEEVVEGKADENKDYSLAGAADNDNDDDDDDDDDDEDEGDGDNRRGDSEGGRMPSSDAGPIPGGMDEATALAIFGDYRQFGSYMMSLSSRLKSMLNNIKSTADPTTRLVTLQELSELLSISTEDTLAGSFQVEQFVRELVKILGGKGVEEDEDGDEDSREHDEDAALAAALAMSTTNSYQGDENLEAQVLACRCLANLMEAMPGVAHTVVYHGAIPVLCSKLIEISYIDLAEQTLSTMEKISEEFPSAIVREGGLAALLNYLDFFSIAVQRTALQAASNCCRNVSSEHFPMIRGVWPIIRNCLTYSDQRLVEFACLCVIRAVDSYHRASIENLESLADADLIKAVNQLLLPAGSSPLIASNTYTLLLRALATSARASAKITVALLEADIVDTLYQILTGVLPSAPDNHTDQGDALSGQGLGGGLADMTVMENLAHRPKDQVEEALSLISELLPPLPKDGVFDHKGYTEKSLARMVKAKAKADRAAARLAAHQAHVAQASSLVIDPSPVTAPFSIDRDASPAPTGNDVPSQDADEAGDNMVVDAAESEVVPDRMEMLRSKSAVVAKFMQLLVPILIDVYAASVITPVRIKTLTGLLKAVSFLNGDGLKRVLMFVPVASFASSILSSKDHPSLVIGALQLVDLLLAKVPVLYKPTFRREGVFHEIESLAQRSLSSKSKEKETPEAGDDTSAPPPVPMPGLKKLSSLSLDPEDAITLRARVIQFKYLTDAEDSDEDGAFEHLQRVVERISASNASDPEYLEVLWELADLFASPHTSVSSFELLKSGIVDGLLQFATDETRTVSIQRRKEILLEAFAGRKIKGPHPSQTPFATLVKKLQESLTRMESFDVITVAQNSDDSKRSSPSLLARQLRLRLVAGDDSDIPRNLHNIVVSIHAIATFQALHDYLRPRVAGLLSSSRLSGMFAALAASGFVGSTSKPTVDDSSKAVKSTDSGAESSADAAPVSTIQRRRSQRLSAKQAGSSSGEAVGGTDADNSLLMDTSLSSTSATVAASTSTLEAVLAPVEPGPSDTIIDSGLQADFTDDEDEVDAEVFDDEIDPDASLSEKTVTVSVIEDGTKIEAQTPDGTRVATPNAVSNEGLMGARNSLSSRSSYAAALKARPTDWHLEFSMDDQILPLDLTIYGAIHQHEMRKKTGAIPLNMIWQGMYTIKFKKISGPIPSSEGRSENSDSVTKNRSPSPTLSSLPEDSPHGKILRLLRVLCQLNTVEAERVAFVGDKRNLSDSAFVNNKLTAKLSRQLEEPMIVASSCLPDWALDLPQHFPFLFPFATRYNFLQSTSFGYARLILKWQSQQTRGQDSSRRDEGIGFLGRLQRQKVRISRKHILESAVKVFELYGSSSSILEVEYFEEVGTGLGPTLEFYSLVSKEFARKDLKLWRDSDASGPSIYVIHPNGLYPAPISPEDIINDGGQKRTHILRVIGQFVAKAMLDSRIIDLSFNKIFLKLVLGEDVPLTIATLKLVDIELANSLAHVQGLALDSSVANDKLSQKVAKIEQVSIEDLALDFTIPGYDIELRPGGRDIPVTSENVSEYIAEVLDAILGKGALLQAKAFREGFSKVFPITDLRAFSADELVMLFGNSDEDWSVETLSEALKADHGFNVESRAIRDLVETMSQYNPMMRRAYLQFITGSPKLPIGGFRGLNPPLTVVRKPHEAPLTADDYLPSVMTCVNYLKLPEYSSKQVMKEKLRVAIQEGVGSFHLS